MSSRYPPPGEQRFIPRDRSPPRFERRPSSTFNNFQGSGPGNRSLEDNAATSTIRDPPREPPRGPKALEIASRNSNFPPSGPRGRGFGFRDRDRDREYYDSRDAPPFRRDGDRDWAGRRDREFDSRDARPTYGTGKSRSPLRDIRDPRDADVSRLRRDSIGVPPSSTDASLSHSSHPRGLSARGRGRSDWGERGRGRGTFIDDRNNSRQRSPSRERIWERERRDDRDRERDMGRDRLDRRDDDRRQDYGDRQRQADRWRDNRPPSRTGSMTTPSTPHPPPAASSLPPSADRPGNKDVYDTARRISGTPYLGPREPRVEDKGDYFSTRHEPSKERFTPRVASPPPATQVPAFGSLNPKTPIGTVSPSVPKAPVDKPSHPPSPSNLASATAPNLSGTQVRPEAKTSLSQSIVQAPTGPRAERNEKPPDAVPREPNRTIDNWSRHEIPFRSTPASSTPGLVKLAQSNAASVSHVSPDQHEPLMQAEHTHMKSPVLQSGVGRPTSSSSSQPFVRNQPPAGIPAGPQSSAPTRPTALITSPIANIPTGPRAQREHMPPGQRPIPRGSKQWISPNAPQYTHRDTHRDTHRVPSIMNTVPVRRDYRPEDKERPQSSGKGSARSPASERSPSFERRMILSPRQTMRDQTAHVKDAPRLVDQALMQGDKSSIESEKEANLSVSLGQSSDEVGEDEDMDLDEEDFEEAEKKFELDMEALKLKKPPSPLKNPVVINLLLRVQALGILASDTPQDNIDEVMETDKEIEQPQPVQGLPSPVIQEGEQDRVTARQERLVLVPLVRPATPSVEDLPFLKAGPLTPLSEMDEFVGNQAAFERDEPFIQQRLMNFVDDAVHKNEELRRQYAELYRPWRYECRQLDELARKRKEPTPLPATPPPSTTPVVTPAPVENRRALKFGSAFDIERVMQESERTHREEQEKRESEAKARADPRREAQIPDMCEAYEADSLVFHDESGKIKVEDALHIFQYLPPPDDFTPDEHDQFVKAYVIYPKRFGKIAGAIPGRDFRQCIRHYYLTKQEVNYKEQCNKGARRKGRKKGAFNKPPRSSALMAEFRNRGQYDGDEFDNPPVTDTGRPRRAAAPTFGDTPADTDTSGTNGPVSIRRGAAKESSDQVSERPTVRRPRGGGGSRGGRKAKSQQPVAVVPGPQPPRLMAQQTSPQKGEQRQDLEDANLLASLHNSRADERLLIPTRGAVVPPPAMPEPVPATQRPPKQKPWTGAQTPTSYWSVPEQSDFPKYVAHFGKDYVAIATHMQTKTPIMVCLCPTLV
jgi:hypothetical protein